jgi:serine/threonine protein phosphatase PrpC
MCEQVTRSIGDFDVKGRGGGLTAEPEISNLSLESEDWVLVLASDGLWEVCGNQEVVGLIRDTVKDPVLCAKRLVTEALARGERGCKKLKSGRNL